MWEKSLCSHQQSDIGFPSNNQNRSFSQNNSNQWCWCNNRSSQANHRNAISKQWDSKRNTSKWTNIKRQHDPFCDWFVWPFQCKVSNLLAIWSIPVCFFFFHQLFHQSIHHFVHFNREPLPIDVGKYVVKDLCLSSYLHDLLMPTILSISIAGYPVDFQTVKKLKPFPRMSLLFDFSIDVQAIGLVTQFEPLKTVQNGTLKISVKLSEQYKEWNNPRFTVQCLIQVKNLECSVFSGFSYDLPLYVNILMPMLRLCAKVLAIFDFKCFADVHLVCYFSPLFSCFDSSLFLFLTECNENISPPFTIWFWNPNQRFLDVKCQGTNPSDSCRGAICLTSKEIHSTNALFILISINVWCNNGFLWLV